MTTPDGAQGAAGDPLPEALALVGSAAQAGYRLKILGGMGVRVLCPDFPPRQRAGQDIDLACQGKTRRKVADHLASVGCQPDKMFNNLNGDRQMYFTAPSGRPVDVMVDRSSAGLVFSTTEEFASCLGRAHAGILNLFVSRKDAFESSVQDRRFVYFSLAQLVYRLGGRLYHLFGEKSPGYDRSQGKPVVEGFFLYGDAGIAESFSAVLAADPRVFAYAQDKRMTLRPAIELLR